MVSFGPHDIDLVTGNPGDRRKFLDLMISQLDEEYLSRSIEYRRNYESRGALLLSEHHDTLALDIYEEKIASSGTYIFLKRQSFFKDLTSIFIETSSMLNGNNQNEQVSLSYSSTVKAGEYDEKSYKKAVLEGLKKTRFVVNDKIVPSAGPHRDDYKFLINEKNARQYGSQGQCRTLAISFKLSIRDLLVQKRNEEPIILIDDAFSELDAQRTQKIFEEISNRGQVFIATPQKSEMFRLSLPIMRISEGKLVF
jgi:DNA replication and repair protein RecF